MEKEQVVKELKSRGLNVILEKGVVMLLYKIPEETHSQIFERAQALLEELDYHSSWGVHVEGSLQNVLALGGIEQ